MNGYERRRQKRDDRRKFKLEKIHARQEVRKLRITERTARIHDRQEHRSDNIKTRQEHKSENVKERQSGRTERNRDKQHAREVGYENGIDSGIGAQIEHGLNGAAKGLQAYMGKGGGEEAPEIDPKAQALIPEESGPMAMIKKNMVAVVGVVIAIIGGAIFMLTKKKKR